MRQINITNKQRLNILLYLKAYRDFQEFEDDDLELLKLIKELKKK